MNTHMIKGKQPTATMEEIFGAVLEKIIEVSNGGASRETKARSAAEEYGYAIRGMLLDTGWLEIIKIGQKEIEVKK